jgi:hypothetical protein
VLQNLRDVPGVAVAEHPPGGVAGEPGREDRQRPHRRLPGRLEQVPAPVDHGLEGLVPLRGVAGPATEQAEAVLQAAGDLGHRHHPHPGRGQLDGQRQPVQVAADLGHLVGGQVGAGAGRPGPLGEQLHRRGQGELREQVHRLRGEAQRSPTGGEHRQVLGHRDQGADQLGGAAEDVLAVVQDQQRRAGTEGGRDGGQQAGRGGPLADRGAPGLPTCSALAGCSGCPSGHSPSTSRPVLAPVRRSPASSASRLRTRGLVISWPR